MPDEVTPTEGVEGQPAPEGSPPVEPSLEDVEAPTKPEGRTVDQLAKEMHRKDEERGERLDRIETLLEQNLRTQTNNQGQVQQTPGATQHDPNRPFGHFTNEQLEEWFDAKDAGRLEPEQEVHSRQARRERDLRLIQQAKTEIRVEQYQVDAEESIKTNWSGLEEKDSAFKAEVDALEREFQADPNKFIAQWRPMAREIVHSRRVRSGELSPSSLDEWTAQLRGDKPHMEGPSPTPSSPPSGERTAEQVARDKEVYEQEPERVAAMDKLMQEEGRIP